MKIYIVRELTEYKIYKVPESLAAEFETEKKDCVVVQGSSIQEVLIGFDALDKQEGLQFNAELVKYKTQQKEAIEENRIRHRQKFS